MGNQTTSSKYMVLIKGIIMILLAFLVFASPGGVLMAYVLYLGIGLAITGIIMIYRGFSLKKVNTNWGWTVFEGVLDLFLGYIIMVNPLVTAAILPFLIGFWAMFYGIILFINAFSETSNKMTKILSGIAIIIIGNLIMHNPVFAGMTIAIWVGIILLVVGIYNVIASFSLKR